MRQRIEGTAGVLHLDTDPIFIERHCESDRSSGVGMSDDVADDFFDSDIEICLRVFREQAVLPELIQTLQGSGKSSHVGANFEGEGMLREIHRLSLARLR